MHREPEVPEERVPMVECLAGLARITREELAITHFVKSGTLQNACSTRPRVWQILRRSALLHIARLVDEQPGKRSKKNDDKKCRSHVEELHDGTLQHVTLKFETKILRSD